MPSIPVARTVLAAGPVLAAALCWWGGSAATEPPRSLESDFSRNSIDIGVVVADVAKSVKFYVEALGFTEVPGFSVGPEFCTRAGLTDGHDLKVRVLVLDDGEAATRLKLMSVPAARPAAPALEHVHSQLGLSYITIHVTNSEKAVARLKDAGGSLISEGIVPIDPTEPDGVCLSVLRDPDGNIVELVGPRR